MEILWHERKSCRYNHEIQFIKQLTWKPVKYSIGWDRPLLLKGLKEQCLLAKDKHGNKKHKMYEKIADEFNNETLNKTANLVALSKEVYSIEKVISIKNISDVNNLFRFSAWVLRFITNFKKKGRNENLSLDKFIQSSEINLEKGKIELYHVMSRTGNADSLSYDTKYPPLFWIKIID